MANQARNPENLPVGDWLYNKSYQLAAKKDELKKHYFQEAMGQKSGMNETSHLIIEAKKWRRLEEVFRALDSDNDGLISASKIEIGNLPADILEIITPLLCEMEELGLELDFETFIGAAEKLFDSLSLVEKDKLIAQPKRIDPKSFLPDCPFVPTISRSRNDSRQSRRADESSVSQSASTVYDSLYRDSLVMKLLCGFCQNG